MIAYNTTVISQNSQSFESLLELTIADEKPFPLSSPVTLVLSHAGPERHVFLATAPVDGGLN